MAVDDSPPVFKAVLTVTIAALFAKYAVPAVMVDVEHAGVVQFTEYCFVVYQR